MEDVHCIVLIRNQDEVESHVTGQAVLAPTCRWITDFLSNRMLHVNMEKHISDRFILAIVITINCDVSSCHIVFAIMEVIRTEFSDLLKKIALPVHRNSSWSSDRKVICGGTDIRVGQQLKLEWFRVTVLSGHNHTRSLGIKAVTW